MSSEEVPNPREPSSEFEDLRELHPINLDQNDRKRDVKPVLSFKTDEVMGDSSVPQPVSGVQLVQRERTPSKLGAFKDWSAFQFKCTKQFLSERVGSGSRTVDVELDEKIAHLRETHKKYLQLVTIADNFITNFKAVIESQKTLAEHFAYMSVRSTELHIEFHYNADVQKLVAKNGETLLSAVYFFKSNIYTVSSKTMEDTLATVKAYETARLSYDAYRTDLEIALKSPPSSSVAASKLETKKVEFEKHKTQFEQLRKDLDIKLKLLETNKVRVMNKQLVLLYNALCAYYAGNHASLEKNMEEFKQKMEENQAQSLETPEWLEQLSPRQKD